MLDIKHFTQKIKTASYSVAFTKNMNLLHMFINKTFLKTCKPWSLMFSSEIIKLFRTATQKNIWAALLLYCLFFHIWLIH